VNSCRVLFPALFPAFSKAKKKPGWIAARQTAPLSQRRQERKCLV
jgi:hypothetical protein